MGERFKVKKSIPHLSYLKKVRLVKFLGSRCEKCFLRCNNKNLSSFEFHHRDPEEKKYNIGAMIFKKTLKELKLEAAKCILLCSKCHREVHSK